MKTTVDLPDDVLTKAKILAAERRTTLRELVLQGLRLVTETPPEVERKKRQEALERLLNAMRAGNADPMVPLAREEIHER